MQKKMCSQKQILCGADQNQNSHVALVFFEKLSYKMHLILFSEYWLTLVSIMSTFTTITCLINSHSMDSIEQNRSCLLVNMPNIMSKLCFPHSWLTVISDPHSWLTVISDSIKLPLKAGFRARWLTEVRSGLKQNKTILFLEHFRPWYYMAFLNYFLCLP